MKTFLLSLFVLSFWQVVGYNVSGVVRDAETNLPIRYATVYVNGSTIGTTSNVEGCFSLSFHLEKCQIVFGHVSYHSQFVQFDSDGDLELEIKLSPRTILIPEVDAEARDLRMKNLNYFKDIFLGTDEWGKDARIKNDSVITFNIEYFDDEVKDSILIGKRSLFEVKTMAPLIIYMPKLGYILEYDLLKFKEAYIPALRTTTIKSLGYFHFDDRAPSARSWQRRKMKRNREKAYFHSVMHFVRSLYANALNENGYKLIKPRLVEQDSIIFIKHESIDLDSCNCIHYSNNELQLTGQKGNNFRIKYYSRSNGKPNDFTDTRNNVNSTHTSYLYFLKDTCTIRKNGTLPGGEILFDGAIIKRRIGAALPFDYQYEF